MSLFSLSAKQRKLNKSQHLATAAMTPIRGRILFPDDPAPSTPIIDQLREEISGIRSVDQKAQVRDELLQLARQLTPTDSLPISVPTMFDQPPLQTPTMTWVLPREVILDDEVCSDADWEGFLEDDVFTTPPSERVRRDKVVSDITRTIEPLQSKVDAMQWRTWKLSVIDIGRDSKLRPFDMKVVFSRLLRGDMQACLQGIQAERRHNASDTNNIRELLHVLAQRQGLSLRVSSIHENLSMMRWNPSIESIYSFNDRMQWYLRMINEPLSDERVRPILLSKLPSEIQQKLLMGGWLNTKVHTWMDTLRAIDEVLTRSIPFRGYTSTRPPFKRPANFTQPPPKQPRVNMMSRDTSHDGKWKCRRCQSNDHWWLECPNITCHRCQQKGHHQSRCRQPKTKEYLPRNRHSTSSYGPTTSVTTINTPTVNVLTNTISEVTTEIISNTGPYCAPLKYVMLNLNGEVEHPALIDGGSQISVMDYKVATSMANDIITGTETAVLQGYGGNQIHTVGYCNFPLHFDNTVENWLFYVVRNSPQRILLGQDWLHNHRCSTIWDGDEEFMSMTIQGIPVTVPIITLTNGIKVTGSQDNVWIPPHCVRTMLVKPEERIPIDWGVLIQPMVDNRPVNGVIVKRQSQRIDSNGYIPVVVTNLSNNRQQLKDIIRWLRFDVMDTMSILLLQQDTIAEKPAIILEDDTIDDNLEDIAVPVHQGDITTLQEHFTTDKWANQCQDISISQRAELEALLLEFEDTISVGGEKMGKARGVEYNIDTGSNTPFKSAPRRWSPTAMEQVDKEIEVMLKKDIIRPSQSPWASSPVLIRKKDGSIRFCVDYRRLNNLTVKDSYPLPRIDDLVDRVAGRRYYFHWDLLSGYWQVLLSESAKCKTAFVTHNGLYEFNVLPFGLCNAPGCFQRFMDSLFRHLRQRGIVIYLDDILGCSHTWEQHLSTMRLVFTVLRTSGLVIKLAKCTFASVSVEFLGYIVNHSGVHVDTQKVEAIRQIPFPDTPKKVLAFLGSASWYRKFIKNFSKVTAGLRNYRLAMESGSVTHEYETQARSSYEEVLNALTTAPVLLAPNFDQDFILAVDASKDGFGAVLSQLDSEGREHPVAYLSRVTTKCERNYSATDLECCAAEWALRKCSTYIDGRKVILYSDHQALQALMTRCGEISSPRLQRLYLKMQPYHLVWKYRPGPQQVIPDFLSRTHGSVDEVISSVNVCGMVCTMTLPILQTKLLTSSSQTVYHLNDNPSFIPLIPDEDTIPTRHIVYVSTILANFNELVTHEDVVRMQKEDGDINWIRQALQDSTQPLSREDTKQNRYLLSHYLIHDDLIYRVLPGGEELRLFIPDALKPIMLRIHHDEVQAAHPGYPATLKRIAAAGWWPRIAHDIKEYVASCLICQQAKLSRMLTVPTRPHYVGGPFEKVAIDLIGPLPITKTGYEYILSVIDLATRWAEAYPLREATSEELHNAYSMTLLRDMVSFVPY